MLVMPPARTEGGYWTGMNRRVWFCLNLVQFQILPPQPKIIIQALSGAPLADLQNLR